MSELVHVFFFVTDTPTRYVANDGPVYVGDEFVRAKTGPHGVHNLCLWVRRQGLPIRVTRWRRVKALPPGRRVLNTKTCKGYVLDNTNLRFASRI